MFTKEAETKGSPGREIRIGVASATTATKGHVILRLQLSFPAESLWW